MEVDRPQLEGDTSTKAPACPVKQTQHADFGGHSAYGLLPHNHDTTSHSLHMLHLHAAISSDIMHCLNKLQHADNQQIPTAELNSTNAMKQR